MRIGLTSPGSLFRDILKIQEVPESSCFEGVVAMVLFWLFPWLLPKEKDHRADSKLDSTNKGNRNWMSTHRVRGSGVA